MPEAAASDHWWATGLHHPPPFPPSLPCPVLVRTEVGNMSFCTVLVRTGVGTLSIRPVAWLGTTQYPRAT